MAIAERPTEEELVGRVQELTARVEALPDQDARETADALAGAIVQLYGEGLERIFGALDPALVAELSRDGVVASLMLIHGLYPVDLETRVLEALDSVRPYMESHGGNVELLGIEDGVARLRLQGSCSSCAASQSTLELAVERALEETAPDLLGIDVEGVVAPPPRPIQESSPSEWVELEGVADLERGALMAAVPGLPGAGGLSITGGNGLVIEGAAPAAGLVIANVAGTLLAYRDRCAGCDGLLTQGALMGGTLTCAHCARRFDLPRAGRCLDDELLQLAPVPLLRNGGPVRVALNR